MLNDKSFNGVGNKEKESVEQNSKDAAKEKRKKIYAIVRWVLGAVILFAGIIFVGINNNLGYNTYQTDKLKDKNKQVVYLDSNSVCEQQFKGYDGTLERVGIYMDNQGRESSTGIITLSIKDESGKVIGTTNKAMKKIRTRRFSYFEFDSQPKLKKGETYTIELQCKDVYNAQKFGVYVTKVDKGWLEKASIDKKTVEDNGFIRTSLVFRYYDYRAMTIMMVMMILGVIIVLVPFNLVEAKIKEKWNKSIHLDKWLSRTLFIISPLVAYFIMESLSRFSFREIVIAVFSLKGVLNLALYGILLLIFYAITNRVQYSSILLWTFTLVLGLTNYFVFSFRGVPVLASDLLSTGTALNVAGSFEYTYDIWVLWAVSIFAAFTGMMLSFASHHGFRWKKRLIVAGVAVIVAVCANYFYVGSESVTRLGIEDSQWKPQLTYEENGSMLSFVTSWKYVKTKKPEGYSVSKVKDIIGDYKSEETSSSDAKTKKMPNVIAIMNESLADFSFDGELQTSEDYIPFIRSMKKNTIKGRLYVSIEGANTANSEFEFLTGNSLAFFAPRAVPYNNYVNGIVPSLTRTLAAQGYVGNNAYHPYKRSGWNREYVYNCLGFNYFYSDEYYQDSEYVRNFISDKSDMEQIIKDYEAEKKVSADPFYLFNVTVQNHGGYSGNRGFVDTNIKAQGRGANTKDVSQYLTLAKKSDEAFEELISYFETVSEPTVIVMFGDHQPPLTNEFYGNLFGTDMNKLSTEQTADWYSTPYVIWANYDIQEKQKFNMSANYLSSYLLQLIDADLTGYNKYLLDLQKKLPVITGLFYAGDDGVFHDTDEKSKYSSVISDYEKVQYNGLFDQDNRINEFFFLNKGDYEVQEETEAAQK